jgi:mannose-1-phosphate guanylyltransferase/mannose-6-phosphate isomerase
MGNDVSEPRDDDRSTSATTVTPVVLCGGSGTRLWPLSRQEFAKQHVALLEGESLFQRTLTRFAGAPFGRPIVIAGAGSHFMVADQAAAVGVAIELALEPEGRDTLAAVTLAALLGARRDPAAPVLVAPSDHLVPDVSAFARAVAAAAELAAAGDLVVFGVRPSEPTTAYGYIEPGAPAAAAGGHRVRRFVEKPDAERARRLIAEGCLWNAGMFCFRPDAALREIEALAPETLACVRSAVEDAATDLDALVVSEAFRKAPKISFDHGIMEKTARATVLPVDFAWSDIGDWKEAWRLAEKDEAGVAQQGPVIAKDSKNSYLRAEDRLICALGVEGLTVVDTADAVLVAPLERSQEVKGLVAELAAAGRPEARTPARVHRPWGWYQTMDLGDRFRVKRIQVAPGKKLSLQKHHHRAEHWVVVRGTAEVTRDGEIILLRENESVYLPLGCVHRLANPGKIPVEIIEIQTGAYLEEDDIVRIEDDFGRR